MPSACPICSAPVTAAGPAPFCSPRCADIDLHRWLSGRYVLPARPDEEDEADSAGPPAAERND